MAQPFLGEIRAVAFQFAPEGWLECDGSLLPISRFAALFSLLGTQYGGDGKSTFALPDLRGRVSVGAGQGTGLAAYANGDVGGAESYTLLYPELAAHSHTFAAATGLGSQLDPAQGTFAKPDVPPREELMYAAAGGSAAATNMLGSLGGNQSHENRQPLLAVIYVIAIQGVFPARG